MQTGSQFRIAIFFSILFMALISAPTIILSFDDSVDVSSFYNVNEEEEENSKLLFQEISVPSEDTLTANTRAQLIGYTFKKYPKPHLNLISPPPEFI